MQNRFTERNFLSREALLLANIPQKSTSPFLNVTTSEEDKAFRESCFAKKSHWVTAESIYYEASNYIRVYLDHPEHYLNKDEASQRIKGLGASTFSTGRIAFGLWYRRRSNNHLSEKGHVAISIWEILEWQNIQKHSRAVASGSSIRITDNYESKHRERVCRDFFLLQDCHIWRQYSNHESSISLHSSMTSPYMHASAIVEGRTSQNTPNVTGFLVSPGSWFTLYNSQDFDKFAIIDQRIFTLSRSYDCLAISIAFYLVEHWRELAYTSVCGETENDPLGPYRKPIIMDDLLKGSMIEIDWTNLTSRFAGRIEDALNKLFESYILGEKPECLTHIDTRGHWGRRWLSSLWYLLPNLEVANEYQETILERHSLDNEH